MARVFGDLNIPLMPGDRNNRNGLLSKIRCAIKLGYEIIALNSIVEFPESTSKKGSQRQDAQIPPPLKIKLSEEDKAFAQAKGKEIYLLNRITLNVTETNYVHLLTSPSVTAYDIVAVQPNSEKLFQSLSSSVDIDIISFDLTNASFFNIKRQQTRLAMNHGIAFEINYSPAIRDAIARQHIFCKGKILVDMCRGKNIILSSGAHKAVEFRGPYDIINLGLLFGLTQAQGKDAVCTNIRSLLLHAEARRLGKGIISVMSMNDLFKNERWKVSSERDEGNTMDLEPSKKKKKII